MKSNYNIYNVPENFFEDARNNAIAGYRKTKSAIRYGLAAMIVATVLIITPLFVFKTGNQIQDPELSSNCLAGMYEYDIFLQVNFTE